jgi:uncharacterized protein YecT (DUF1311 family)
VHIVPSLIAFAVAVFASQASAFDCAKATTETEKLICAEPALKAADGAMSAAYARLAEGLKGKTKDQLKISQRNFIINREFCGSGDGAIGCIVDKTAGRIEFLNGGVEASGLKTAMPAMEPVLVQQTGDARQGLYTIDYTAPRFLNPASAGEKAFNAAVEKLTSGAPLGPEKEMIEFASSNPWEHSISARITLLTDALISAAVEEYSYEGGAHGNSGVSSLSFYRKTGEPFDASALLGSAGVAALVPVCRDQIVTVKSERQSNFDPGTPYDVTKDDFYSDKTVRAALAERSSWRLEPGKATVVFNAYALGAYAEGRFECVFSGELLSALTGGKLNIR